MKSGNGYKGQKGESGKSPNGVGKGGAYATSARRMGGASTPNQQSFNSEKQGPLRGGSIKGGRSKSADY